MYRNASPIFLRNFSRPANQAFLVAFGHYEGIQKSFTNRAMHDTLLQNPIVADQPKLEAEYRTHNPRTRIGFVAKARRSVVAPTKAMAFLYQILPDVPKMRCLRHPRATLSTAPGGARIRVSAKNANGPWVDGHSRMLMSLTGARLKFHNALMPSFAQEDRADYKSDAGNDHRIIQPCVNISRRGDHGQTDQRQQAAEDAVADMVRQRKRGVSYLCRKRLDQIGSDRAVDHRDPDDLDKDEQDQVPGRRIRNEFAERCVRENFRSIDQVAGFVRGLRRKRDRSSHWIFLRSSSNDVRPCGRLHCLVNG